ncbi:tyrosine-type recombinase/integrase [Aromatoleum buckelii]|uniref:Tyrosine-type recombinase/integrase n=1 Tax=Aromatoleum buckelii TaxID=200254 RepID=A0ABX1N1J1_9RHOO|nr:tyrosine-type recombinase/integrase [Aromatoleum buckelii]MCK0512351.1 tyrosine-type recombinase/integrase [Aromatoleum buckelii]
MPNIERRNNTWYATLHVPSDVREKLGKSKFFQTLKTSHKATAESRASVLVARWKTEITQARGGASDPFIEEALVWRRELQHNPDPEVVHSLMLEHAEEVVEPSKGLAAARAFVSIAIGQYRPLSQIIPEWKASQQHLAAKTVDQMVKDVGRMVQQFPTIEGINRKSVREWLDGLSKGDKPLSPSSITRIVGFCRNFWRYLQETQEVPEDEDTPFVVPSFAKVSKRNGTKKGWIPFHPSDVVRLHAEATKNDQPLADLILLGAYTGARIEELCSLKLADVGADYLRITDAKTEAGNRTVPIHSALVETVERLKKTRKANPETGSDDGYLLSGLTFNKYGDRSNAIGKRFGRLKDELGYGEQQVFHSIRKTVVTMLENAGVSENLTADIVGHDKPRITYGLYSGGASLEVMREAIERIRYPLGTSNATS